jgi:enoyl-CoA hydratase
MDFILTGLPATGAEFERLGVVSKAFPAAQVLEKAMETAARIASLSGPVVQLAKKAVLHGDRIFSSSKHRY